MPGFDLRVPEPRWVETEQEARQWIDRYLITHRTQGGLGLDTETTGLDCQRDSVVIWSISDGETRLCLERKFLGLWKEPILENPEINFDLTKAKFDAHMFANSGIDISRAGEWRDTTVQSWLRNENNQGRHGLKECVSDVFGRTTPTFEETFGKIPTAKKGEIRKTTGQLIREFIATPDQLLRAADYASLDAYNSTMLRRAFDAMLETEDIGWGTLKDYFYLIEVPFTKVLWKMERRGICVDKGYLLSKQRPMELRMEQIRAEFNKQMGDEINLDSNAHLRHFFFDHLKKPVFKETKGGKSGIKKPSTDVEVLEAWAGDGDPWALLLLDYRSLAKTYGTYITGLQDALDPSYRIHTTFNQTGTVTGRLSSSGPNIQNLPRAEEDEFRVREAFIGGERKQLLVVDYEQLEMRLMAHFSSDTKMIEAIRSGLDLHCYTTSEMEGIPYEEVLAAKKVKKKEELTQRQHELLLKRQQNKSTGFGIIYGIGGPKLARKLTRETKKVVSEDEGWALIEKWLGVFPDVDSYIRRTKEKMADKGYVSVITGRKRRFGDVRNMNRRDASQADRQAVNSIIQGTAAELAKIAMIKIEADPEIARLGGQLLLQVHDELILEVPDDPAIGEQIMARVKAVMEHPLPYDLAVPIPVSGGLAPSWADAK